MTAIIFYRPSYGPEERAVKEFASKLHHHKVDAKLIEFDGSEATHLRELYDITNHPTIVLARDDGSMVQKWTEIPLISDISYLAHS